MALSAAPVIEDVTLEQLEQDPYPHYARWRKELPVAFLPELHGWIVSRWDDCEALGKSEGQIDSSNAFNDAFFGHNILSANGDVHKWLRGGVDPPLRPRAVQGYIEERARPVAREYTARLVEQGRCDASRDLLELISVRVIGDVLGLTDVDDATLQEWFTSLNAGLNNFSEDPVVTAQAEAAKKALDDYMVAAFERLMDAPDESGLSHMIHTATKDGTPRTFEELRGTIQVIILGGFQEPGHGAAASLLGVLSDLEQRDALLADPDTLVPAAVHEGLRWIAPFGQIQRRAIVDLKIGDVVIPAGDEVNLACASANRDETRYDDGERFDLHRKRQTHASFGYGAHFCSGHFISRQLERIALEEVFAQLPNPRLDPDHPADVFGFVVRGVKSLPIVWDA
ncbi:MAG TPA: cytochrome P450 [Solirubrobacteraceae bacterium]|nr:cytochrome P450 [Solirubrobacteraceae bacterium]